MRVQVTQKHIDSGLPGSCTGDPISLAMKDAGLGTPWSSPISIRWTTKNGDKKSMNTPEDVLYFMKTFDNEGYVEPFEFELEET